MPKQRKRYFGGIRIEDDVLITGSWIGLNPPLAKTVDEPQMIVAFIPPA